MFLIMICPICATSRCGPSFTSSSDICSFSYFFCSTCSLLFQDPTVPMKEGDVYNAKYIIKRSQGFEEPGIVAARERTAEYYYDKLEARTTKGNLLEVGCATGLALKVAKRRGWKVFGLEVNKEAALMARQLVGFRAVQAGELNEHMFPDEYFSLVTMFDVLEHIQKPVNLLALLRKKMAPFGRLFLVTPDINSISFRLLKNKWPHCVQEHLFLYSPKAMNQLLRVTGFRLLEYGRAPKYVNLVILRRHLEVHPKISFYRPVHWLMRKASIWQNRTFQFNMGEMYVLAERE